MLAFGPSLRWTLPLAGLAPAAGFDDLTTRTRRPLFFRGFGLRTVPSLQPAASSAVFARARVLPTRFGTTQAGGGGGGGLLTRVYAIAAEQIEVLPAASVAVAEKRR